MSDLSRNRKERTIGHRAALGGSGHSRDAVADEKQLGHQPSVPTRKEDGTLIFNKRRTGGWRDKINKESQNYVEWNDKSRIAT